VWLVTEEPFSTIQGGIAEDGNSPLRVREGNQGKPLCLGGGSFCLQEADLGFSRMNTRGGSDGGHRANAPLA